MLTVIICLIMRPIQYQLTAKDASHKFLTGDYEVEQQPGSKKLTATIPTELGNLLKWKYVILRKFSFCIHEKFRYNRGLSYLLVVNF